MKTKQLLIGMVVAALALLGVACSSNDDSGFDDAAQQSCVAQLSPQQIQDANAKLQQAEQNGLQDPSVNVDTVCTYNPDNGDLHYYHRNDGLQDYLLYAAFTGRATSFGAMYMLSGGDPFDAILMDSLIGVNRYGTPFYPYSQIDGGYRRAPQVINNKTVTNVYVGAGTGTKESYSDSLSKPPAGVKPVTLPKSSDVTGEGSLGDGTKPATKVAPIPGKDGQKDAASKPVKKVASGASVTNPAKKGTQGSPTGGSSKSGSSGGSKSGSSGSSGGSKGSSGSSGSKGSSGGSSGKSGGGSSSGGRK